MFSVIVGAIIFISVIIYLSYFVFNFLLNAAWKTLCEFAELAEG